MTMKSITVTQDIDVDVDLGEFDTDELIMELIERAATGDDRALEFLAESNEEDVEPGEPQSAAAILSAERTKITPADLLDVRKAPGVGQRAVSAARKRSDR